MFKKIKQHFAKKKAKQLLQKRINLETLEALASICRYLDIDGRRAHNAGGKFMYGHYLTFNKYSKELKEEIIAEEKRLKK